MHLAVFGGTFDPPHNGHLALCLYARELLEIDRIIISVSNNPFKQKKGAADEHRKRMAECLSSEINLTDQAVRSADGSLKNGSHPILWICSSMYTSSTPTTG